MVVSCRSWIRLRINQHSNTLFDSGLFDLGFKHVQTEWVKNTTLDGMHIIYWDLKYFTSQLKQNPKHLAHYEKRIHWKNQCWNGCFERMHWYALVIYVPALAGYRGHMSPALADWFQSSRRWSKVIYDICFTCVILSKDLIRNPQSKGISIHSDYAYRLFSHCRGAKRSTSPNLKFTYSKNKLFAFNFAFAFAFTYSCIRFCNLKKCIKNSPTKKAVSVLWFLKETCISEANNFAQKNQCWQSDLFVTTNVKRPFLGIIFLQKQGVKC